MSKAPASKFKKDPGGYAKREKPGFPTRKSAKKVKSPKRRHLSGS